MTPIKLKLLSLFSFLIVFQTIGQQKVGLVLSGGGATGLAHIGVLKALEEKGIPIDYITGTSSGALVGSLYAAGYSPEEIEAYILSEDFQLMTKGKLKPSQHFIYKEENENGSIFDFSFSIDSILQKSLPTSLVESAFLDYEMMKLLGPASACNNNNFDNLFVPFRCIASDVTHKKSIVFSSGNLNEAVRASMTYPFYFSPIRINGLLLFDGGLYNNFPADVMYNSFDPDYIIGSNVSYNAAPPTEDDLISQITNMLVSHSDFNLPCEAGIIIEPKTEISTFDFESVEIAIQTGYEATLKHIDSICIFLEHRITKEELNERRKAFRSKIQPLNVSSISNNFYKKKNISYARKTMINDRKNEILSEDKLEKRYYRLYATPQIEFVYPTVSLKTDSTYNLDLKVRKSKDFKLYVGGHFSSRPVNTGYVGLSYRIIGKTASTIHASSYFGKFYGSAKVSYSVEIPSIFPVSVNPYFVMNRWDYFRSFATFFEDVHPSFLVQNELYYGLRVNHPIGNTTKSTIDFRMFELKDNYYQTSDFTNKDTSDVTTFDGFSTSWEFVKNSLNRKQFSNEGHYFKFKARLVQGTEISVPGSTNISNVTKKNHHQWINLNAEFQSFVVNTTNFHLGLHGKGVFNSQSLFSNYTATLLAMTSFSLLPDAETFFLPEYRSPQHVGGGINAILTINKNIDFRFDGYYYQPFMILQKNDDGTPNYSKPFKGETYMAGASIVYNSIIGPLRATINYFPKQTTPFFFQISFGYVLFNERAIR